MRRMFEPKMEEVTGQKTDIIKCFLICTVQEILFG